MTVTQIIPLDKRRSKVFIDEDLALVLYQGEIRHYKIEEGQEIGREIYDEIVDQVLFKRARDRAVYLLKASDKTELQMRRKLEDGYYPGQVIDRVVEILKQHHYIDDESYGFRYVENHRHSKSRRQLIQDLQQKGLDRELIRTLLEEQPVDEADQIQRILEKKGYDPESDMDWKTRQKVFASLARKGFSYDAIDGVLRHFGEREEEAGFL
ncbi:MAG: regulatory protein RecX [Lachnospiraceae bacterium]